MNRLTTTLLLGLAGVSIGVIANTNIPAAIYQPANATAVETETDWDDDDFDYEATIHNTTLGALREAVIDFYRHQGFEMNKNEQEDDEVELAFSKGKERVKVDIEREDNGTLSYEVDYDKK